MVLHSKLFPAAIATDERVIAFAKKEAAAEELQHILQKEQQHYLAGALIKIFNWNKVVDAMEQFQELIPGKKLPDIKSTLSLSYQLLNKAQAQAVIAGKFQLQLQQLLNQVRETGNTIMLEERVVKGITYFVKSLAEDILQPLREHIASLQYATKVKKYVTEVTGIEGLLNQQLQKMMQASYGDIVFFKDPGVHQQYNHDRDLPVVNNPSKKQKPVKGSSQAESLALFKEGKTITAIASLRQLAESTVSGHLSAFVKTGELDVLDLLTEERVNIILPVVKEIGGDAVLPVKEILGDDFSFADIRIVLNHWHWLQQKKVNA
jgi:hypothetical protein